MTTTFTRAVLLWLYVAVPVTLLCGLLYATVQQVYRQNANDPQVQIVEDIVRALEAGAPQDQIAPPGQLDVAQSLAPFIVLYDVGGQPAVGNGYLDGALLPVPQGVFDAAKSGGKDTDMAGQNRVTLEPRDGVRIASVVQHYQAESGEGYVLAGRSLREVESRESALTSTILLGWLATLAVMLVLSFIGAWLTPRSLSGT